MEQKYNHLHDLLDKQELLKLTLMSKLEKFNIFKSKLENLTNEFKYLINQPCSSVKIIEFRNKKLKKIYNEANKIIKQHNNLVKEKSLHKLKDQLHYYYLQIRDECEILLMQKEFDAINIENSVRVLIHTDVFFEKHISNIVKEKFSKMTGGIKYVDSNEIKKNLIAQYESKVPYLSIPLKITLPDFESLLNTEYIRLY